MDLAPAPAPLALPRNTAPARPLPRIRAGWPVTTPTPASDAAKTAKVAQQFEALIAETLLHSVRAAGLGDDGLGGGEGAALAGGADNVRDMIDHVRAEAIARAAPMGIARLLARAAP